MAIKHKWKSCFIIYFGIISLIWKMFDLNYLSLHLRGLPRSRQYSETNPKKSIQVVSWSFDWNVFLYLFLSVVPAPTSPTAKSADTLSETGSQDSDGAVGPRYMNVRAVCRLPAVQNDTIVGAMPRITAIDEKFVPACLFDLCAVDFGWSGINHKTAGCCDAWGTS